MLRGLRKASSNWIGKIIMAAVVAFLVGSFAIWGIGDIFRGYGLSTAAKVGRTEISIDQFRQIYNDRLQQIAQQIGRPISLDQARALGIDRQIMAQLTAELALDERARALRLGLSDEEITRRITGEPSFRGPNGQFDRARFQAIMQQMHYTEQRFVAEERTSAVRRQLSDTIMAGPIVPQAAIEAVDRYQNEQRSIDYVLLDHELAGTIDPPTPEVLAEYFNQRKILFRAPEYRKVELLPLLPSDLANTIEVSDADAKAAYEDHRDSFGTPERRQIQQMVFPNMDAAKAASDRIAQGASFSDIAKERGLADKDIDLGTLTKSALIDKAVADAAFAVKEGETSQPVQGRFGVALVHIVKIEPGQTQSFEEVAPEIKKQIATGRAKSQILSVYDKIEDVRSEGHTVAEAAAMLKLPARTIELDRSGHDPDGNMVENLGDAQKVLTAAFSTEVGVDTDPLQANDGYVWYEVDGITPSHDRTLDEIKNKVEASWREDEIAKRLQSKAMQILDQLKGGSSLSDVAASEKLAVQTITGLKRGANSALLSPGAIDQIFRTAKDAPAVADAQQPGDQIVFRVTDITTPKTDLKSAQAKSIADGLNRSMSEDVFGQYISQVEHEIGVTINNAAVNQVITGNQGNPGDQTDYNF
jgi:peptidyl-prolyl cis-trans isomerase D